jgi:hypothetical protein
LADDIHGTPVETDRALYAMEYAYVWTDGRRDYQPRSTPHQLAVIHDRFWYLNGDDGEELYSMDQDPRQQTSLIPDHPALADLRGLAEDVEHWEGQSEELPILDEDLLEHLRSLGYIE